MYERVVLKLSGEYLAGEIANAAKSEPGSEKKQIKHIDINVSDSLAAQISNALKSGVQIALVIGGGNFWRGRDTEGFKMNRSKADNMGMLASVMNGIFLSERFAAFGVDARVMTAFPVGGITEVFNRDIAISYLKEGKIVIFAGGTGQPFFSTDTISVIRAAEIGADCVLFAKDVEGVYDRDPRGLTRSEYNVYKEITASDYIAQNLKVIDTECMFIARGQKVNAAVFDIREDNAIEIACSGNEGVSSIGTRIICE
jgi:uridylate kinase